MRTIPTLALTALLGLGCSTNAAAQRLPFERSFDVSGSPSLDVSTNRGKIDVRVGDAGRIVVTGTAPDPVVTATVPPSCARSIADDCVRTSTAPLTPRTLVAPESSSSGRISVEGTPKGAWTVSTGSGAVDVATPQAAAFDVEAETHSGSVKVEGRTVRGSTSTRKVQGAVGGGGPLLRLTSRSGSIRIGAGS